MRKILKGDEVIVLTGKDKGKRGTVLRVLDGKLVVEGVNRVRKAVKPNPMRGTTGVFRTRICLFISPMLLCLMRL